MNEIIIALVSVIITVSLTTFINANMQVKRDMKLKANSFKLDILLKIYKPALGIIYKSVGEYYGNDGTEELTPSKIDELMTLIKTNNELVDVELNFIVKYYYINYH